jgi:AraC family transcriptional regulator, ethanolamine operon transcriptional activator
VDSAETSGRCSVANARFLDIDALRETLVGWDTEPTQLGRGLLEISFNQVLTPDFAAYHLHNNLTLADRSAHESGWLSYVVCFTPKKWCGLEADPGSIVIKGPIREHRSVLGAGWESLTIAVSDELAAALGFPFSSHTYARLSLDKCVIPLHAQLNACFQDLGRRLLLPFGMKLLAEEHDFWVAATRERALHLLQRAFADAGNLTPAPAPRTIAQYDLTVATLIYIEDRGNAAGTVSEIAAALGVSARSLQMAFKGFLGVSPLQYLLARRLRFAQREIAAGLGGQQKSAITEAALSHGFEHLSRFAEHYRRLFGELPSQTLRRVQALS